MAEIRLKTVTESRKRWFGWNSASFWILTISVKQKKKYCVGWYSPFRDFGGLSGAVVKVADCYRIGAGFDSRVMHGFFPHVKEVEVFLKEKKNTEILKMCVAHKQQFIAPWEEDIPRTVFETFCRKLLC
jgi:hypothetical protein